HRAPVLPVCLIQVPPLGHLAAPSIACQSLKALVAILPTLFVASRGALATAMRTLRVGATGRFSAGYRYSVRNPTCPSGLKASVLRFVTYSGPILSPSAVLHISQVGKCVTTPLNAVVPADKRNLRHWSRKTVSFLSVAVIPLTVFSFWNVSLRNIRCGVCSVPSWSWRRTGMQRVQPLLSKLEVISVSTAISLATRRTPLLRSLQWPLRSHFVIALLASCVPLAAKHRNAHQG
ncbi:hypothetical protein C8R47DRAFT_1261596, partial [Mycena vitilis]